LTKIEKEIAGGIVNITHAVEQMGSMLMHRLDGIDSFLRDIETQIDLGILVSECQASVDRIAHRHTLMTKLEHDQDALTPAEKQSLVKAILDINLGSELDTMILHSVLTGDGRIPGVEPALETYRKKGYKVDSLSQVYSALFVFQTYGYSQLYWAYLNQLPNISFMHYNDTDTTLMQRLEVQWWQFGAPWMWNCHWDNGFICPEVQECYTDLQGFKNFTCNHASAPVSINAATQANQATIGTASANNRLQILRDSSGNCTFGIRNCEGNILSPVPVSVATCGAGAHVDLSTNGVLTYYSQAPAPTPASQVLANVSAANATSYALFVNETGEITIMGTSGEGDRRVLWSHAAPPNPTGGPCPTDFTNRELKAIKPDTVNCSCIHTAEWRGVARGRANITGSWCSRLCQVDPSYVAAAPRANGECWCATEEAYQATIQASNCEAKCLSCPGAPVEPCGINNTVAIYKWEDDQLRMQPSQAII